MATLKEWQLAQYEERKQHTDTIEEGLPKYKNAYRQYFKHLEIDYNQLGKRIIEIGCADFPALYFCKDYTKIII